MRRCYRAWIERIFVLNLVPQVALALCLSGCPKPAEPHIIFVDVSDVDTAGYVDCLPTPVWDCDTP